MRQVEQLHTPTISADSRTASHFQKAQTRCLNSQNSSVSLQGAAALFSATAAAVGTHGSWVPLMKQHCGHPSHRWQHKSVSQPSYSPGHCVCGGCGAVAIT